MEVLLFEDMGTIEAYVKDALEQAGYKVFSAFNVNDAQTIFEDEEIDALIVDLNVDSEGLTDKQRGDTRGGLLTGWIWLRDCVYTEHPEFRKKTIIYSVYLDELTGFVSAAELTEIVRVSKREDKHIEKVMDALETMAKLNR